MLTETEKREERAKDEIVQQIYDLLEAKDWGSGVSRLTIRVVFEGRMNMMPIAVNEVSNRKLSLTDSLKSETDVV